MRPNCWRPLLALALALLSLFGAAAQPEYLCACKELLWAPTAYEPGGVQDKIFNIMTSEVAAADAGQGYGLLFYGDSITQHWREGDNAAVFQAHFGRFRADALGVGGSLLGHLWWGLQHGEAPRVHAPKVMVVLIGTNDIGAVEVCTRDERDILAAVPGANSRMRHVLATMRAAVPDAHIVVLGILPRGGWTLPGSGYEWPNRMSNAIAAMNNHSQALTLEDDRMHFLDCGAAFVNATAVSTTLTSDGLHPNAWGYEVLAACLQPLIDDLMADTSAAAAAAETARLPATSSGARALALAAWRRARTRAVAAAAPVAGGQRRVLKDVADKFSETCANATFKLSSAIDDSFAARLAASAALNKKAPNPQMLLW